ncbi:MAG: hypothetical protein H2056_01335 [Sphingopyxis sp.]|nr:hypothetical protein [Sphingopyxis sp.]
MALDEEALRATKMLAGRIVSHVRRFSSKEILVEFADGTRLFVDSSADVELSITGDDNLEKL